MTSEKQQDRLEPKIRPIRPSDLDFIKSSWKTSYKKYAHPRMERDGTYSPVYNSTYFSHMENKIEGYLHSGDSAFLVACDPEDEDFIWGWSCVGLDEHTKPCILRYAYTRHAARRQGVASRLTLGLKSPVPVQYWTIACEYISVASPGRIYYCLGKEE